MPPDLSSALMMPVYTSAIIVFGTAGRLDLPDEILTWPRSTAGWAYGPVPHWAWSQPMPWPSR
jgi:hypothetical protein